MQDGSLMGGGDAAYHREQRERDCGMTQDEFDSLADGSWKYEIERLRKQRDELVSVLGLLANACKDEGVRGMDNLISKCDSYLAKIEGKKNG